MRGKFTGSGGEEGEGVVTKQLQHIDIDPEKSSMDEIADLCIKSVDEWSKLSTKDLQVVVQSGGVTNKLFKVKALPEIQPKRALVRVYGAGTDAIIDRTMEQKVMQIFQPVYAIHKNGIVYAFLEGRPLDTEDCLKEKHYPAIQKHIAYSQKTLAESPAGKVFFEKETQAWVYTAIPSFCDLAMKGLKGDLSKLPKAQKDVLESLDMDMLKKKGEELLAHYKEIESKMELAICHNDLLAGNIISNDEAGTVQFIDFEYTHVNFSLYDLANHFNEARGLEVDTEKFPTMEVATPIVKAFLEAKRGGEVTDEEATESTKLVFKLSLASDAIWSFWSILQTLNSSIDFDFADYAKKRFDTWLNRQEAYFAL